MELKPGDVVILKSGGHPLSVVEVSETTAACVWMGNEGDLFRETLPLAVLELAEPDASEDEEDDEEDEEDEDEDDEEEDEDEDKKKKK
ncbi:MAG: YodC family protein [Xanthobacteraceae bacterium]|nr:YodC family protein [Xanthobacteraceae bacterium]